MTKAKLLLAAIIAVFVICSIGCGGPSGCSTATPGATGGTSGGAAGGSSPPPSGCVLPSGGGGGNGTHFSVLGYFVDFTITGTSPGMALQKLDPTAANTFISIGAFLPPVLPNFPTGIEIVNKTMLYVSSSDGTLFAYRIDPLTGNLTSVGTPYTVAGGDSIAASASDNLLFVGDVAGQQISVFTVNADASLTAVTGSPFPAPGVSPRIMATDGQSKFLYATGGTGSSLMAAFSIDSSGVLTPVSGSPFPSSMAMIAGERSGNFLFGVTRLSGDNHVYVFRINSSTGALTQAASPALTQGSPYNLSVHPTGNWVYSLNRDGVLGAIEPIEGFSVDASSGGLTPIGGSPFDGLLADGGPIDATGGFMFGLGVRADGVGTVTPYAIDQTTGGLSSSIGPAGFPGIDAAAYALTNVN